MIAERICWVIAILVLIVVYFYEGRKLGYKEGRKDALNLYARERQETRK